MDVREPCFFAKIENAVFPQFGLPVMLGYLDCYLNSKEMMYMQGFTQMYTLWCGQLYSHHISDVPVNAPASLMRHCLLNHFTYDQLIQIIYKF